MREIANDSKKCEKLNERDGLRYHRDRLESCDWLGKPRITLDDYTTISACALIVPIIIVFLSQT